MESIETIHVPNTGPMVGLLGALPAPAFLSRSSNAARKYALTLEWIRVIDDSDGSGPWVGIHSAKANAMVRFLLEARMVPGLPAYDNIQAEVRYGENSRLDFFLSGGEADAHAGMYVEVKSVTMAENTKEVKTFSVLIAVPFLLISPVFYNN
jgi:sugar fermentation stimulation protein A